MLTVLIWVGWIYLGGLVFFSVPMAAAYLFRDKLSSEERVKLDAIVLGQIYLSTLGWPFNLALILYIHVEEAKMRRRK